MSLLLGWQGHQGDVCRVEIGILFTTFAAVAYGVRVSPLKRVVVVVVIKKPSLPRNSTAQTHRGSSTNVRLGSRETGDEILAARGDVS